MNQTEKKQKNKIKDMGTFVIRVQQRQNSTWQGRITWADQDKTISFRSIWEMLNLIESAVATEDDSGSTLQVSWED